jgi:hypothetical protein
MPVVTSCSLSRRIGGTLLLLAAAGLFGCGGGESKGASFPVEGALRWKDGTDANEFAGCTVEFEPTTKIGQVAAKTEVVGDGTFTLMEKPPPGEYRLRLVAPAGARVDKKYQSFASSGLSAKIGAEDNQQLTIVVPAVRPKQD